MGALMGWLLQAVRFAGPASIGYFFNDLATGVSKLLPTSVQTTDPATGKLKPWFVIAVMLLGGLIVYFVLKMLSGKRGKMLALIGAGGLISSFFPGDGGFVLATALVTLTTGAAVVTTANTTFVPRVFFYAAATQLTGVKITVQGDGVIFDSDANGLTHCGLNRIYGQVTNGYIFRIANGFIGNKNTLWEFTNSAAQTPVIYYDSDITPASTDRMYLQLLRQTALIGGTDFVDFATLSFPSMAAADYCNILYDDGTQQSNVNRLDLQAFLQFTQNIVNTPLYQVDNYSRRIKKVNIQVAANQTAYVQRWVRPQSDGMISQAIIATGM